MSGPGSKLCLVIITVRHVAARHCAINYDMTRYIIYKISGENLHACTQLCYFTNIIKFESQITKDTLKFKHVL